MSKTTSIFIAGILILGAFYVVNREPTTSTTSNNYKEATQTNEVPNSEIKDGVQYVTITARGGYSPRVSTAKAGIPTKIIVKTNNTYDCSAALLIRQINFRKILPPTGETIVDAGTPETGSTILGVCGMGMYSFQIKFN